MQSTLRRGVPLVVAVMLSVGQLSVPARAAESPPIPPVSSALHLQPPLSSATSGDPARADTSLSDHLAVHVCKLANGQCAATTALSSSSSGPERLHLSDRVYRVDWRPVDYGAQAGDVFRLTFRTAGLDVGSSQLGVAANGGRPADGSVPANQPVHIRARVDNHPVIRTRAMHQSGKGATEIAAVLRGEFALDDATAMTLLYDDVRAQQLVLLPSQTMNSPFTVQDLVDAVTAASTYGDSATRAAQLLAGRFSTEEVVGALVHGANLNLSSTGLLEAIRDGLGITDEQEQANALFVGGVTAVDALLALLSANPALTPLQGLQRLALAGYDAAQSIDALAQVMGAGPDDAALAGLQVFRLPIADVRSALSSVYGTDGAALLKSAVARLVPQKCAEYSLGSAAESAAELLQRGGLVSGEVVELLRSACSFNAVQLARIVKTSKYGVTDAAFVPLIVTSPGPRLPAHGTGGVAAALRFVYALESAEQAAQLLKPPAYGLTDVARGLRDAYYPLDGLNAQAIGISKSLKPVLGQATPVEDLLLHVGTALRDTLPPPAELQCAATLGAAHGDGAGFEITTVLGSLDRTEALRQLFPNAFSPGENGNLSKLGGCLAGKIPIPFPLLKVDVNFTEVDWGWTFPSIPNGMLTGRIGVDVGELAPGVSELAELNVPGDAGLRAQHITAVPAMAFGPAELQWCGVGGLIGGITYWCDEGVREVSSLANHPTGAFETSSAEAGKSTMVIPALPLEINVEAGYFSAPAFSCSTDPVDAAVAAAVALPGTVYQSDLTGGGKHDLIAFGSESVAVPATPVPNIPFTIAMPHQDAECGRIVNDDYSVSGNVSFSYLHLANAVGVATKVSVDPFELGGTPYSVSNLEASSNLDAVQSATGNFLALLGRAGLVPPSGENLATLLTTGKRW